MMKRVCKTRVGACAMLLAVFLLAGGVGGPAFARDDMSNGQTGDPGDGLDRDGGGGDGKIPTGDNSASVRSGDARSTVSADIPIILIPVFDAYGLHFVVVFNFTQLAELLK